MSRKRAGLTLMELVVVMVILMALAAIVLPLFPSMIERAHRASQGTNDSEITKAIQMYQSLNGVYPDGYDLLTDGTTMINYMPSATAMPMILTGDTANQVTNYLGFQYPVGGYISSGTLTPGGLAALNNAGIVAEYAMANGATQSASGVPTATGYAGSLGWTPTFNPYTADLPTATTLTTSTAVIYVNGSGILAANLANPSIVTGSPTQFVMFGLGKRCSAIGTTLANATYNFPNDAVHENPDLVYERFGVIFQLEGPLVKTTTGQTTTSTPTPLPSAQFIGVVAIESNILLSVDKVNESYTDNIPQASAPVAGPGI
jgi:type II secretory pathway pseudopilin PulG